MKFKTNIPAPDSLAAVKEKILRKFPDAQLKFELENTDGVLHIHGVPADSHHAAQIESAIKEAGFDGSWLTEGLENK